MYSQVPSHMGDKIVKSKNLCCQPVVFPSLSLLNSPNKSNFKVYSISKYLCKVPPTTQYFRVQIQGLLKDLASTILPSRISQGHSIEEKKIYKFLIQFPFIADVLVNLSENKPFDEPWKLETVQDFLIKLGIKLLMHLVKISTFSLNNVIVRLTKIMNRVDKNQAHF